ncbi:UrcA family protein [Sphingomonas sp. LB-2]|uniref:UrcA family protein n=1 Tax=Sphingomonas caeni TaxID=2984949 RepID=UPI002230BF2A|nr:UrcA family protein [Sphingomonas caeni]MCW3849599.1 UrcA family protein [Sphingomonas caeni]
MITSLIALSLLAAPAITPDPTAAANSVTVSYRDLNLRDAADRAELDRRVTRAVRTVCPVADNHQLQQVQSAEACRIATTEAANRQLQAALASAGVDTVQIGSSGR